MSSSKQTISIIGAGGLGTPALLSLLAELNTQDKFRINIFDGDKIERSNLNRQILFTERDLNKNKAEVLAAKTSKNAANLEILGHSIHITDANIDTFLKDCSIVIDATDSTEIKFLLNDWCTKNKITFIYGGVVGTIGQILLVNPNVKNSGCLRCLFGDFTTEDYKCQTTTCREAGILGPIAGIGGALQGALAVEYLNNRALPSTLIRFTDEDLSFKRTPVVISPECNLHDARKLSSKKSIDLTDKTCPETFLYTKLTLEQCLTGEQITFYYSENEILKNVQATLINEGFKILASNTHNNPKRFSLIVENK